MPELMRRLTILALGAVSGVLVFAATAGAATNFGSRLVDQPANSGECANYGGTCTLVSFIHPIDPEGDPYAGGAPVSGVITKFRIRAWPEGGSGPATATFRIVDIERPDPNDEDNALAASTGTGPTVTIPDNEDAIDAPITEVDGRLPVKQGQHLGIDASPNLWATKNDGGNDFSYVFSPPLVDGSGKRGSNQSTGELLVAATIEPDADGDGFGDETQDQCPRQATTQGPCDDTRPGVSGLSVKNGRVNYRLSEAASVELRLERKLVGRRVGKKCVKQTKANRNRKRCARFRQVKRFNGPGKQGLNKVTLPGGKKLKPGAYRLTIVARDAAGNETTKRITFKVKKKKKRRARR